MVIAIMAAVIIVLGTGGVATPVAIAAAATSVAAIGYGPTLFGIRLAAASRSIKVLERLRNEYDVISHSDEKVVLRKKSASS